MSTYFAIDGDKIGTKLEALIIAGQLKEAAELSRQVALAIIQIEQIITTSNGNPIFSGGDNLLAEVKLNEGQCRDLVRLFNDITKCTASAGIGDTPREAYLALKLAKGSNTEELVDYRRVAWTDE
jgi:GTP cyclohydrolase III